ncbi:MAG TPA: hypothetical protein VHV32_14325 [Candidatus Angelobacter sp.]|jgi:hypothetical protein|nr:hypothetical protein [Candidatus Angelobacter sp.]
MKCEICKTIEKLGLDPATHDPWVCADSRSASQTFKNVQVAAHHFYYGVSALFHAKWHHAGQRLLQRVQFVTLGL